jgi:hypothetical protein
MSVTATDVRQLRSGAEEARKVNIHRLARLLDEIGNIAKMIHEGADPVDLAIGLDDLVSYGTCVARDLCRTMPEAAAS